MSEKKPDLWMPFYFGAYLTDTMHLSTEQHGAYFLLLMACWKRGGELPDDDAQLAATTRLTPTQWRKARAVIAPFWQIGQGVWKQKRLTRELEAARERSATATENGKKGGRPRKPDDNPKLNPEETQQKPGAKPKRNPDESSGPLPRPLSKPLPGPGPGPTPSTSNPSATGVENPTPPPSKIAGRTIAVWRGYSDAYRERYGVDPVRNKTVNAHLANFVDRIPAEEAPGVAAFYVRSNRQLYVAAKHATNLLLRDAEGLRTEWATGRSVTETEARQADRTQANGSVFGKLINEAEKREANGPTE